MGEHSHSRDISSHFITQVWSGPVCDVGMKLQTLQSSINWANLVSLQQIVVDFLHHSTPGLHIASTVVKEGHKTDPIDHCIVNGTDIYFLSDNNWHGNFK